jgi:alkyl sulfatase BDS1-like metallo-beta-lactamase superfamily hydrolase
MATKKKKPAPEPVAFFTSAVPRVLRAMRATCAELGGSYGVTVDDSAFVIDFASASANVAADVSATDVAVTMTRAQFESLATGKVELLALVRSGAVASRGDVNRLENLSLILAFLEGRA